MKIAIIEDETPALNRLKKMVGEIDPAAEIIATADSIESAVEMFNSKNIELALMDIELADGQSFEIFNRVDVKCPVIFTTAYDEFALKAFKVNSIDYLLKPVEKNELKKAIEKFRSLQNTTIDYGKKFDELLINLKLSNTEFKSRFLIKSGTKLISVAAADISYIMASDKTVYLFTKANQKYIIDYSLEELSNMLDPQHFFHLNRQFIVSLTSIASIHTYFNGKLKMELIPPVAEEVIVSRDKAGEFKKWLDR